MAAYQNQTFAVFAPWDLAGATYTGPTTAASALASLVAWGGQGVGGLNAIGHRCEFVTGGAANEVSSAAITRATGIMDPNFITIGVGQYSDSDLGSLSTSQLAPRLAGIIAARGSGQGLTFARLARLSITQPAQYTDILLGIQQGYMTIGQDSNQLSPVRFERGVTTWSVGTTPQPVNVFGQPKFMLTMQQIERDLTLWAQSNVIGIMPVDDATVKFIINYLNNYLKTLNNNNEIQTGYTVTRALTPVPQPTDDFIALTFSLTFLRDTEKVLNTVLVQ